MSHPNRMLRGVGVNRLTVNELKDYELERAGTLGACVRCGIKWTELDLIHAGGIKSSIGVLAERV